MKTIALLLNTDEAFKDEVLDSLALELEELNFNLIYAESESDLIQLIDKNKRICGVVFDWDNYNLALCERISELNEKMPLYAFLNKQTSLDINFDQLKTNIHFYEYVRMHAKDIAVRINLATEEYLDGLLPPFTKALFKYVAQEKYTFCTPGHAGGTAFEQSPVGSLFYDFYGQNTMRSDISISMGELGSLLDHSGPHREAEDFIAETFNAERSFIVTNGTSTANKIVGMYACHEGSTVLVDRNCHKSITHLLMMTNIIPIYLKPTRNAYGILGGIPKSEMCSQHIADCVKNTKNATKPVHAIITNSTYDGLFYNTQYIKENLDVPSIHFDSAWVPYTQFHPIYKGKSGMCGEPIEGKVFYETQSTHKLLAAFSQASMVHIKGKFNERIFNEGYMMHTSTSPLYSIVASCEISAAMMKGNAGKKIMDRVIERAMNFRKEIIRLREESNGWFFNVWQPENIDKVACWDLDTNSNWHGFKNVDEDYLYLDPTKITILTPGLNAKGTLEETGIPASIVTQFLSERRIVVEKTGPYSLLFLFSVGTDKSKSLTLLKALIEFKQAYDANLTIKQAMPGLYAQDPEFYRTMKIQDLAQGMHKLIKHHDLPSLMYNAFDALPVMEMTPHQAYQAELKGHSVDCLLSELEGKVSANMILPYPPGVPLIMPGEKITKENKPILDFLEMLCEIGSHYPGFETDIHGVYQNENGENFVRVLKMDKK